MIRSELKYLIEAKIVTVKCQVFGGKTSPFPTFLVFHVIRPIAMIWFRLEPDPELTREFGPVANTIHCTYFYGIRQIGMKDRTLIDKINISKMYFSHWKPAGVSERMWSVNLDTSIPGEYQTLRGHSC